MHCPRCGSTANAAQPFCRSCGLNLEKIAAILEESTSVGPPSDTEIERLKERQKRYEHWGGIAGLIAFAMVLILFIALIFSQMILKGGLLILPGSLLIFLALGVSLMVYFQASAKSLKEKLAAQNLPRPNQEQVSVSELVSPASVTEQTTRLLAEPNERSTHEI